MGNFIPTQSRILRSPEPPVNGPLQRSNTPWTAIFRTPETTRPNLPESSPAWVGLNGHAMTEFNDVRAVVLAGGSGTRLWPLSRLQAPKQFLRLTGEDTLLEATVSRLSPGIDNSQVLIVTNEQTAPGQGFRVLAPYEKILEPAARTTPPAIAVASVTLRPHAIRPVTAG